MTDSTIPLPAHWAQRVSELEAEQIDLVSRLTRSKSESNTLARNLGLDAGRHLDEIVSAKFERKGNGWVLIVNPQATMND